MFINKMMYFVSNDHTFVSNGMNLKCMAAISYLSYNWPVRMHTIDSGIKILIKHVLEADDMTRGSFHCYELHLQFLVVSE